MKRAELEFGPIIEDKPEDVMALHGNAPGARNRNGANGVPIHAVHEIPDS